MLLAPCKRNKLIILIGSCFMMSIHLTVINLPLVWCNYSSFKSSNETNSNRSTNYETSNDDGSKMKTTTTTASITTNAPQWSSRLQTNSQQASGTTLKFVNDTTSQINTIEVNITREIDLSSLAKQFDAKRSVNNSANYAAGDEIRMATSELTTLMPTESLIGSESRPRVIISEPTLANNQLDRINRRLRVPHPPKLLLLRKLNDKYKNRTNTAPPPRYEFTSKSRRFLNQVKNKKRKQQQQQQYLNTNNNSGSNNHGNNSYQNSSSQNNGLTALDSINYEKWSKLSEEGQRRDDDVDDDDGREDNTIDQMVHHPLRPPWKAELLQQTRQDRVNYDVDAEEEVEDAFNGDAAKPDNENQLRMLENQSELIGQLSDNESHGSEKLFVQKQHHHHQNSDDENDDDDDVDTDQASLIGKQFVVNHVNVNHLNHLNGSIVTSTAITTTSTTTKPRGGPKRGPNRRELPPKLRQKIIDQFIKSGGDPSNIVASNSAITTTLQSKKKTITTVYKLVPGEDEKKLLDRSGPSAARKRKLKRILVTRMEIPRSVFMNEHDNDTDDDHKLAAIKTVLGNPATGSLSSGQQVASEMGEFYRGPHDTIFGFGKTNNGQPKQPADHHYDGKKNFDLDELINGTPNRAAGQEKDRHANNYEIGLTKDKAYDYSSFGGRRQSTKRQHPPAYQKTSWPNKRGEQADRAQLDLQGTKLADGSKFNKAANRQQTMVTQSSGLKAFDENEDNDATNGSRSTNTGDTSKNDTALAEQDANGPQLSVDNEEERANSGDEITIISSTTTTTTTARPRDSLSPSRSGSKITETAKQHAVGTRDRGIMSRKKLSDSDDHSLVSLIDLDGSRRAQKSTSKQVTIADEIQESDDHGDTSNRGRRGKRLDSLEELKRVVLASQKANDRRTNASNKRQASDISLPISSGSTESSDQDDTTTIATTTRDRSGEQSREAPKSIELDEGAEMDEGNEAASRKKSSEGGSRALSGSKSSMVGQDATTSDTSGINAKPTEQRATETKQKPRTHNIMMLIDFGPSMQTTSTTPTPRPVSGLEWQASGGEQLSSSKHWHDNHHNNRQQVHSNLLLANSGGANQWRPVEPTRQSSLGSRELTPPSGANSLPNAGQHQQPTVNVQIFNHHHHPATDLMADLQPAEMLAESRELLQQQLEQHHKSQGTSRPQGSRPQGFDSNFQRHPEIQGHQEEEVDDFEALMRPRTSPTDSLSHYHQPFEGQQAASGDHAIDGTRLMTISSSGYLAPARDHHQQHAKLIGRTDLAQHYMLIQQQQQASNVPPMLAGKAVAHFQAGPQTPVGPYRVPLITNEQRQQQLQSQQFATLASMQTNQLVQQAINELATHHKLGASFSPTKLIRSHQMTTSHPANHLTSPQVADSHSRGRQQGPNVTHEAGRWLNQGVLMRVGASTNYSTNGNDNSLIPNLSTLYRQHRNQGALSASRLNTATNDEEDDELLLQRHKHQVATDEPLEPDEWRLMNQLATSSIMTNGSSLNKAQQ